jgi:hypothetical protein
MRGMRQILGMCRCERVATYVRNLWKVKLRDKCNKCEECDGVRGMRHKCDECEDVRGMRQMEECVSVRGMRQI